MRIECGVGEAFGDRRQEPEFRIQEVFPDGHGLGNDGRDGRNAECGVGNGGRRNAE
jgi:hypothetical protein